MNDDRHRDILLIKKLQEENKLLRECVEFYAEVENWNYTKEEPTKAKDTLKKLRLDS